MWAEKTPNEKVKFVERYTHPMTGEEKKVSITLDKDTPRNRKIAQKALGEKIDKKVEEMSCGTAEIEAGLTLKKLVERYREDQKVTVETATYDRNYHAANTLCKILGEDTLVERLSAAYIRNSFIQTKKKGSTLNEHRTRLKAILRWGYNNDMIADIRYLDKLQPFHEKVTKQERIQDKFMEQEEYEALLRHMWDTGMIRWWHVTRLMILSGMRIGELMALETKKINARNKLILVDKKIDIIKKTEGTTKTLSSMRELYIQEELRRAIRKARRFIRLDMLDRGYQNKLGLLIPGPEGKYFEYATYNKYLKETAQKVIAKKVTTHTLRHTHASILAEQDVSLDAIMRRLGHKSSKVTKDIYIHVTKKRKEKDRLEIDKAKII